MNPFWDLKMMLLHAGLYSPEVGLAEAIYRLDWHAKRTEAEQLKMEVLCQT